MLNYLLNSEDARLLRTYMILLMQFLLSENLSPSDHLPNTTPKGHLQNGTLLYNLTTCPETSKNNSTWSKPLSNCHYIVLVHN